MPLSHPVSEHFDLIIVGAGPAGCTLALHLAESGLKIAMIEKDRFPRSKICGDALSGKVINILRRIPGNAFNDFIENIPKVPSHGIRFMSPSMQTLDVPFGNSSFPGDIAPGYVCSRKVFDQFLFSHVVKCPQINILQGIRVLSVKRGPEHMIVETDGPTLTAKMVAGADGVHSVVRQNLAGHIQPSDHHFCLGIRSYFRNVSGMAENNFIELMFLKPLLPGYFWIFPGDGGISNVGLGVPKDLVIRKKIKLIALFRALISEHPALQDRFIDAEMHGKPEAHALPLGTYRSRRYGDGYILLGDAGFMVDPFSGEGIGNAMGSAESAVPVILDSFKKGDFSQDQLANYQQRITKRFEDEFRIMGIMQNLVRYPALMNLVVRKAARNEELRKMLSSMFTQQDIRSKLTRPGFYMKLLMK